MAAVGTESYHAFTSEHISGAKPLGQVSPDVKTAFEGVKGYRDKITTSEQSGFDNHLTALLNGVSKEAHDSVKNPGGEAEKSGKSWPWILGSTTIGVAVTALIVWAIMHSHDKKLLAQIASANSQNNGGQ